MNLAYQGGNLEKKGTFSGRKGTFSTKRAQICQNQGNLMQKKEFFPLIGVANATPCHPSLGSLAQHLKLSFPLLKSLCRGPPLLAQIGMPALHLSICAMESAVTQTCQSGQEAAVLYRGTLSFWFRNICIS